MFTVNFSLIFIDIYLIARTLLYISENVTSYLSITVCYYSQKDQWISPKPNQSDVSICFAINSLFHLPEANISGGRPRRRGDISWSGVRKMAMMRGMLWRLTPILRGPLIRRLGTSRDADTPVLNEALRHLPSVRLISESGEDCGLMSGEDAFRNAQLKRRDVMQVRSGRSETPVLRIVDYEAMKEARRKKAYDRRKEDKELRKMQRRESALKQVRLSPSTDTNDVAIKVRQARQFLIDGYRVKVFMLFRRGQGGLHETAKETLIRIAESLSKFGNVQGLSSSGSISTLFDKRKPNRPTGIIAREVHENAEDYKEGEDEEEDDEEEDEAPKKKPLEVLLYPLPRKERSNISVDELKLG